MARLTSSVANPTIRWRGWLARCGTRSYFESAFLELLFHRGENQTNTQHNTRSGHSKTVVRLVRLGARLRRVPQHKRRNSNGRCQSSEQQAHKESRHRSGTSQARCYKRRQVDTRRIQRFSLQRPQKHMSNRYRQGQRTKESTEAGSSASDAFSFARSSDSAASCVRAMAVWLARKCDMR